PLRRHGGRAGRSDQDRPAELAANEPGALRLLALEDQLLPFHRERNLVTGLEMQGLPKAMGYDQLALGRDGYGTHSVSLTRLTSGVKKQVRNSARFWAASFTRLHQPQRGDSNFAPREVQP